MAANLDGRQGFVPLFHLVQDFERPASRRFGFRILVGLFVDDGQLG